MRIRSVSIEMFHRKSVIFVLISFAVVTKQESKTVVSVYYETFCHHCSEFITKQLYPTFLDVGGYLKVEFIPFGNTTREVLNDSSWSYFCKEGPKQCLGNKLQACAEKGLTDSEKQKMCYISCTLFHPEDGPKCAASFDANDNAVAACVNSVEGDILLAKHENRTLALNLSLDSLPIITFNGIYNETEQILARSNLLKLLCDEYFKHRPYPYSYSYSSSSSSSYYLPPACEEDRARDTSNHKNFKSNYFYPYSQKNCRT